MFCVIQEVVQKGRRLLCYPSALKQSTRGRRVEYLSGENGAVNESEEINGGSHAPSVAGETTRAPAESPRVTLDSGNSGLGRRGGLPSPEAKENTQARRRTG